MTEDLKKYFPSKKGAVKAVDGVDLSVLPGEIFGFLGPNGAGKTTTLRMLTTLIPPDSGRALVAGFDVFTEPDKVRRNIGYVGQSGGSDLPATGRENLVLQGRLYSMTAAASKARAAELIDLLDLEEFADRIAYTYSGGQRRRLDVAVGLMNRPQILFLDEPTTGLDPQARRNIWDVVDRLREQDKTVVITTHYIEEAEQLCDRVAIMDLGKIIDIASPTELIERYASESSISFRMQPAIEMDKVKAITGVLKAEQRNHSDYTITTDTPQDTLAGIFQAAYENDAVADEIAMRRATLEDVFLKITGRSLKE
jgi:ABC-2 type transport system ATP-binding protein